MSKMFTLILSKINNFSKIQSPINDLPLVELSKEKIKNLRSIDRVLENIIEDEEKLNFQKIQTVYFSEKMEEIREIKIGKYKWIINKNELNDLLKGKSIFYITERKVYIPVSKMNTMFKGMNTMFKGIIEERGITIEIKKELFDEDTDDENNKIKIIVISSDDEYYNILMDECKGKLLILPLFKTNEGKI